MKSPPQVGRLSVPIPVPVPPKERAVLLRLCLVLQKNHPKNPIQKEMSRKVRAVPRRVILQFQSHLHLHPHLLQRMTPTIAIFQITIFTKMIPLFIHVPKTGGQSVHRAMGLKNGPHRPLSFYKVKRSRYVFTVVRNPYDRAISLWKWYSELHERPMKKRTPHNAAMNVLARKCESADQFWLNYLDKKSLSYQLRYSPMLRPQMFFLKDKKSKVSRVSDSINRVIRFENLSDEFEGIKKRFGFKELPHINSSKRLEGDEMSEECRSLIRELYPEDFEVLYPKLLK